ncbi:MAG: response regulator [Lachnospiraceae bacterium]|nr:response regulator [Lachnospiraceae bacterium]
MNADNRLTNQIPDTGKNTSAGAAGAGKKNRAVYAAILGGLIVLVILIYGTFWMARTASKDTENAVRTVSLLYLDELAGRRERVVENNLQTRIRELNTAISLMSEDDLCDEEHLQHYQTRTKELFTLNKFAFVDTEGLIHTSTGIKSDIDTYSFDYNNLTEPSVSIYNLDAPDKKVIIAIPVDLDFEETHFKACFMEIDMQEMLAGASMSSSNEEATFCNIYTRDGVPLSNLVLGGLAVETNLLEAMTHAKFETDYSYETFSEDFQAGGRGAVSFIYNGIRETLSYVPVNGTDWILTYLIRESVISDKISPISRGIIARSVVQSILTVLALLIMFGFIIAQGRHNQKERLEHETSEAAARIKQEEMEQRIALQERLLEEEKRRSEQDNMITAMATDYRSVYYVDLEKDESVCYRSDPEDPEHIEQGTHFPYYETFKNYAEAHVTEPYRAGFLRFIDPDSIRENLKKEKILAYRYLAIRGDKEYYEMLRVAGVRRPEDPEDDQIRALGVGFTVIDAEMRSTMAQQQALSDALSTAEQANHAKTAFLSSMSHEIRTPMNAIIGLDNIALNDPETPAKTRGYLEKIGSSAEHLLNLINDILDMSRIESGRMTLKNELFSFQKLLEAINTMFSSQCQDKGLNYQCRLTGDVDNFYIGDNMKLRQVLINILGNAVKFTPAGGSITFTVERTAHFDGKSALRFTIADTGIGMSKEFLPHIFDTFAQEDSSNTSRYGSSGLGMAITKNIVSMMNGNIEVESEKGKGSVFTVTVTLDDAPVGTSADENDTEIRPEDMTVLVVDDDPVACEHAQLVLGKAGISTETATSGKEAIEMVRLRHARREPFNLILVDWKMPEMDGVEATRRMREIIGHESAIIILTAYRWDDVLEEALQAGVDSFVPKPLFADAILEEFRSACKAKYGNTSAKKRNIELNGRHVLLAEDVAINAEIIVMILESRGITADHVENGRLAVEKFLSREPGYYDAVLMDIRMPEMDGLEATRAIRALDRSDAKDIPIIALTANAFDEDVQRSLQAGLNAHLSKPVQPEALFETLESLIKD